MTYRERVVDGELASRLSAMGAVLIEGPRASGKTETARQIAKSEVLLDLDENARRAAELDPFLILEGPVPRLIDEWQLVPSTWNAVRRAVDARTGPGQFVLTGSAVPADDHTRHTGAGRISRLQMRPMSLSESGQSTGAVSLRELLAGEQPSAAQAPIDVRDLATLIAIGGWPAAQTLDVEDAMQAARSYLNEIRRVDVQRIAGPRRDPERLGRLLRSLARNVATTVSISTLAADTGGSDGPLKRDTVREYLVALERLGVVEEQPAWAPHLRSRYVLRSAPKRHFTCPSLAVAALRATPDRLLGDLELLGFLFESLVVRDLRVYAQAADAWVSHYRDSAGLEVDAIVETADGRWLAAEIKLGHAQVEEAAQSLLTFAERIDTRRAGSPTALAVITSTGYAYVREDGVAVIPIGALGP